MNVINIDDEIMSGAMVFAGTRVPIQTLFDYIDDEALAEFYDGFPSVSREQVQGLFALTQKVLHLAFKLTPLKTLNETRDIVRQVLEKHTGPVGFSEVKDELIESSDSNRFLVIGSGWEKEEHQHEVVYDVQVREDGVVIIHADNTDKDLADYLISAGIPEILIVKGYYPESVKLLAQVKAYGS